MANALIYIFLAIIVIFSIGSFWYVYVNNFSRETLDILYPAVGAIVFSMYLGLKIGFINAPEPEKF